MIVPIYNVVNYLAECLDSLEKQTQDGLEIILVNDGSTDGSEEIAKEFVERNSNFILINRENGGLSAARNTGLDVAKGEYVYFLDSDDYLADDAIEKLYQKAKTEQLDQLRFVAYTFLDGTQDYKWIRDDSNDGYKYLGDYPSVMRGVDFYQKAIDNNDYYPSCCLIFTRREIIEKNNLRFYEGILHEDNLFNFQLTLLCERVSLLHEPLYYRRYRAGSITNVDNWIDRNMAMCISAEEADKFIEAHPWLKDTCGIWQIKFFVNSMLYQWEQMSRVDQESSESKECFRRVNTLIKKYSIKINGLKLFFFSHTLYRFYKWGRMTGGRLLNRKR